MTISATRTRPTHGQVMRRPRWLAALALALAVAAGFAWLGKWQMGSAITTEQQETHDTETVKPLDRVTGPGEPITEDMAAQVVSVTGSFVPGDSRVVSTRMNQDREGFWVAGHLVTEEEPASHLAVALGWAASEDEAQRVLDRIEADPAFAEPRELIGRYMPAEGPPRPDKAADPFIIETMAPAQLVNLWAPFTGHTYPGFLVSHEAPNGLTLIDSVPPLPQDKVNLLNLFYAAEWVVFAGFALYFWYRITKDAWEKELDE
ncbi:SURF1 family cytochrome oxidase biogenesis protein, partial [Leucobacter sp. M11]|uniref:SURF1 family cytochrome oxidase biogenesis protein n=1 Tax=Leucobacter sp. M11 TaxID=2993565 RepID=UPI002D7E2737